MRKRAFAILLVMAILASLAGCGKGGAGGSKKNDPGAKGFLYLTEDNELFYSKDGKKENVLSLTRHYLDEKEMLEEIVPEHAAPMPVSYMLNLNRRNSGPEILQRAFRLVNGGKQLLLVSRITEEETGKLELVDLTGKKDDDLKRDTVGKDVLILLEPAGDGVLFQSDKNLYYADASGEKQKMAEEMYGLQIAAISSAYYVEDYRRVRKLADGKTLLIWDEEEEEFYTIELKKDAKRVPVLSDVDIDDIYRIGDNGAVLYEDYSNGGKPAEAGSAGYGYSDSDELSFTGYGYNRNYVSDDVFTVAGLDGKSSDVVTDASSYLGGEPDRFYYLGRRVESTETDHPSDCIDREAYTYMMTLEDVYYHCMYADTPDRDAIRKLYDGAKHLLDELLRSGYCSRWDVDVWDWIEDNERDYDLDDANDMYYCFNDFINNTDFTWLFYSYLYDYNTALREVFEEGGRKSYVTAEYEDLHYYDGKSSSLLAEDIESVLLLNPLEKGAVYTALDEDGEKQTYVLGSGDPLLLPEDYRMAMGFLKGGNVLIYANQEGNLMAFSLSDGSKEKLSKGFLNPTFTEDHQLLYFYETTKEDRGDLCVYDGKEVSTLAESVLPEPFSAQVLDGAVFAVEKDGTFNRYVEGKETWIADKVTYFTALSAKEAVYLSEGDLYYFDGSKSALVAEEVLFVWPAGESGAFSPDDVWMGKYNQMVEYSSWNTSTTSATQSIFARRHK